MKFDMTEPCPQCPFRSDIRAFLTRARAQEIADSITRHQQPFPCHKTVLYDDDGEACPSSDEQHCAGALVLLERINRPNQMMRIAERLGVYKRTALNMNAPIFKSTRVFVAAQPTRERRQ
jgi:hypothetical protein